MKRKQRIILFVIVSFIIVGTSIGIPVYYHYKSIKIFPFTIISYQLNPTVGEEWILNGSIRIGDSCWRFKLPIIDMNEEEKKIVIIIKAKRDTRGGCLFAVFDVEMSISLIFPITGQWGVRCNDKFITVYVQEDYFS